MRCQWPRARSNGSLYSVAGSGSPLYTLRVFSDPIRLSSFSLARLIPSDSERLFMPRVLSEGGHFPLSLSLSLSLSRRGECARVAHFLAPNKHTRVRPTAWTSSWIYVVFCIRHFPSTRIWYTYVRMCVCRQGRHSRLIISSARALTLNFENLFGNYWPSLSD